VNLHVLHASTDSDLDTVFASLIQLRAGALMIGTEVDMMRGRTDPEIDLGVNTLHKRAMCAVPTAKA
jgi:hypothetical protein